MFFIRASFRASHFVGSKYMCSPLLILAIALYNFQPFCNGLDLLSNCVAGDMLPTLRGYIKIWTMFTPLTSTCLQVLHMSS